MCVVYCRSTCEELKVVIEQLEQERGVASKRARRLQDELQKVQQVSLPPPSQCLLVENQMKWDIGKA